MTLGADASSLKAGGEMIFGSSASELSVHYDLGNEFYASWLDPTMSYSCAMFAADDDLEAAQIRKLDFHLECAGVYPGARLLDIGCGWGALLARASQRFPGLTGTGLTIASAQADYVRALGLKDVEVLTTSWCDFAPQTPYDAIVSVGAFEHFARVDAPEEERLRGYRHFFARCWEWLAPGGAMSLQTIAYGNMDPEAQLGLMNAEMYPGSELPHLADIAESARGLFEIVAMRNDREDYVRTLRAWIANLRTQREAATAVVGGARVRRYLDYLRASQLGFHLGTSELLRLKLRRVDRPRYRRAVQSLRD